MAKSASSQRWLREHRADPYVKKAHDEGLRSRAAYKLQELDARDRLFAPGQTVVDLGAAPGGWCQIAATAMGPRGRVIGVDLLPMDPIPGITLLEGDFTEQVVLEALLTELGGAGVDVVISDMAPNMSGVRAVDQPRSMYLCELAEDFARQVLKRGGSLVTKTFHGEGFDAYIRGLRQSYERVYTRKPGASRGRSREVYVLARGFKMV